METFEDFVLKAGDLSCPNEYMKIYELRKFKVIVWPLALTLASS